MSDVDPEIRLQPQPVPVQANVGHARLVSGESVVTLQLATPTGVHFTFLPPPFARQLGAQLIDNAKAADAALIVPPPGAQIHPRENGHGA